MPLSLTEAPLYDAYDGSFSFPYDPAKARQLLQTAGYSASNPLRLKVMTTRGVRARTSSSCPRSPRCGRTWGSSELEVITIPQWFQFRTARGQGAGSRAALALLLVESDRRPHQLRRLPEQREGAVRVWESEDLQPLIDPIFDERDEPKRIAAAKKAARYVVEKGYVVPLFQVVQPVVMKKDLSYPAVPDRRADPSGDVLDVAPRGSGSRRASRIPT